MGKIFRRGLSPSMAVAIVALVLAASGSAVAASKLVSGDSLIKTGSLSGNRLKNHTLTGEQINLSKLGTVPSAASANTAKTATTAGSAPISQVTYVTSSGSLGAANIVVTVTASCPAGTYVIGGGASLSNLADSAIIDSGPDGQTGWTVHFYGDGATGTETTTAICAPAASTAT